MNHEALLLLSSPYRLLSTALCESMQRRTPGKHTMGILSPSRLAFPGHNLSPHASSHPYQPTGAALSRLVVMDLLSRAPPLLASDHRARQPSASHAHARFPSCLFQPSPYLSAPYLPLEMNQSKPPALPSLLFLYSDPSTAADSAASRACSRLPLDLPCTSLSAPLLLVAYSLSYFMQGLRPPRSPPYQPPPHRVSDEAPRPALPCMRTWVHEIGDTSLSLLVLVVYPSKPASKFRQPAGHIPVSICRVLCFRRLFLVRRPWVVRSRSNGPAQDQTSQPGPPVNTL
jgi:hypothetical protein